MSETFSIHYHFAFSDEEAKEFTVVLNQETLALVRPHDGAQLPAWTELGNNQCTICPFDTLTCPYCPIALNLAGIVDRFKDCFSYTNVDVTVTTEQRCYAKTTSLQEGLSSLIGIIMVTSGCRPMERLKPMVQFHLPFATLEETVFRTTSMYLVTQYLLQQKGKPADFTLNGLEEIYEAVGIVNTCFAKRLLQAAKKDANINALVNLHCFAQMVPLSADDMLQGIENHFSAFF